MSPKIWRKKSSFIPFTPTQKMISKYCENQKYYTPYFELHFWYFWYYRLLQGTTEYFRFKLSLVPCNFDISSMIPMSFVYQLTGSAPLENTLFVILWTSQRSIQKLEKEKVKKTLGLWIKLRTRCDWNSSLFVRFQKFLVLKSVQD